MLQRVADYPMVPPGIEDPVIKKYLMDLRASMVDESSIRLSDKISSTHISDLPWVDVRDYGAKGDGATDDTVAIQAAIDATPSFGTTYFPPGVNPVASSVTITKSDLTLDGPGRIEPTGANTVFALDIGSATKVENVRINIDIGYEVPGDGYAGTAGAGIYISNAERIWINGSILRCGGKGLRIDDVEGAVSYVYYTGGQIGFNTGDNIDIFQDTDWVSAIFFSNLSLRTHNNNATQKLAHGLKSNAVVFVSNSWMQLGNENRDDETRGVYLYEGNALSDGKLRLSNTRIDSGSSTHILVDIDYTATLRDTIRSVNSPIDGYINVDGVPVYHNNRQLQEAVDTTTLRVKDREITYSTAVPTTGTYTIGDLIFNKEPDVGEPAGWACITNGTFSAATDATGDTDGSTAVITGMTDTSDFYTSRIGGNDYVSVSAGFPTTGPYRIVSTTATTITIDTNSDAAVANITVSTPDPTFAAMANLA